jgi:hypothetical protein
VEVVAQDCECVDIPTEAGAGFAERGFEGFCRARGFEEITAVIAAINAVVNGSWILKSPSSASAACEMLFGKPVLPHPILAGFGYALLGGAIGVVSVWVWPASFVHSTWGRLLSLCIVPGPRRSRDGRPRGAAPTA